MLHNTFAGFLKIVPLGDFLYEGTERSWDVLGATQEENDAVNSEYGNVFEVKVHTPFLGNFPDGDTIWVVGSGSSLEEALDKARFCVIFQYARQYLEERGWKKQT